MKLHIYKYKFPEGKYLFYALYFGDAFESQLVKRSSLFFLGCLELPSVKLLLKTTQPVFSAGKRCKQNK